MTPRLHTSIHLPGNHIPGNIRAKMVHPGNYFSIGGIKGLSWSPRSNACSMELCIKISFSGLKGRVEDPSPRV
jgi:hypothetical protein